MTVGETHLRKSDKFKLEGFKWFTRNRQNAAMGGITKAGSEKHVGHSLKIGERKNYEYLITQHSDFVPALNIINLYGKQESRQTKEETSTFPNDNEQKICGSYRLSVVVGGGAGACVTLDFNRHR